MKFMMSDKTYDVLKTVCTIILPAIATLYASLSGIWGWSYSKEIVESLTAVDLFLGAILGISNANYRADKGEDNG